MESKEFCDDINKALEVEISEAFDSLIEHLRKSKKLFRKKQDKLGQLEDQCKHTLKETVDDLEQMCMQVIFVQPIVIPSIIVESDKRDFAMEIAKARAELQSVKRRQVVLQAQLMVIEKHLPAQCEAVKRTADVVYVPELIQHSHQAKRLKHLSECTVDICTKKNISLCSSTNSSYAPSLEEMIDMEKRGMPSRQDLQTLDTLLQKTI